MCGIVGYIGDRSCIEIIFKGLQRLEYRGYDSAGIAVSHGNEVSMVKSEGKLAKLEPSLSRLPQNASRGIGHTRWATHGVPDSINAHPHVDGAVALVHNGIIENYEELKSELQKEGVKFLSQTDTEVALQVFVKLYKKLKDPEKAVLALVKELKGAFSLGIMLADRPDELFVVKYGSPLVIGRGQGENFFASDAMALVGHTNKFCFLNDKEIARITPEDVQIWNFAGEKIPLQFTDVNISSASTEKQGFRHYMLKEIHEQPRVMSQMVKRFVDMENRTLNTAAMGLDKIDLSRVTNIHMVACGTAYYSAVLGRYMIEPTARLPVNVELASEFRYRDPWLNKDSLVIAVSQSGETADTLACVKHAREVGAQVFSVCNVPMSSIPRESHSTLYMEAGPEIGVASTKAFTGMLLAHYFVGLALGVRRGLVSAADLKQHLNDLRNLPALVEHAVDTKAEVEKVCSRYYESTNFIFMGRGTSFPIALEGALKLKEISYIHAEGYAGGELKHGPIALIDRHMPVVAIAPRDSQYEKMVSNIEEVKARQGKIIAVGAADDEKLRRIGHDFLACPEIANPALQAIISIVPLQLLSYYIAVMRGTDVDQPRNLAKSVTVE
jgi:glucosamine--fructose-6-phosphate aminotransferase (isomerizing)